MDIRYVRTSMVGSIIHAINVRGAAMASKMPPCMYLGSPPFSVERRYRMPKRATQNAKRKCSTESTWRKEGKGGRGKGGGEK